MEKKGSALYMCPGCGAFVSENASICPKCGESLDSAPDEESLDDIVTTESELEVMEELAYLDEDIAAGESSEPVTLYLCTVCGAFTGGDARTCPKCGSSMQDEEEPESLIKPEEPESEIVDMLVTAEPPPPVDEHILEDLKKLESAEDVESFLEAISDDEGMDIDISLVPPEELLPERSDITDELLSRLVPETEGKAADKEEERSEAFHSVEEMLAGESARTVVEDSDTIALCRHCGAFVSESAQVCNVCGNSLEGDRRVTGQEGSGIPEPESDDDGADAVLRDMLGVSGDADLDRDAGRRFQSDGSLGLCTVCGAFVSQDAESCPVCGTHMEDMPEFVPSLDILEPEQEDHGLAICPHCGVFVQEGARECLSCVKPIPEGATVPISDELVKPEDPDSAAKALRTFLGVEKALEMAPVRDRSFRGLDLCPDCGAFVSMDAVVCSICGNSLFEDSGDGEVAYESVTKLPETMRCPNCGIGMEIHSEECPSCGMSFVSAPEAPEPEGPGDDITEFLDRELDATILKLESAAAEAVQEEPMPQADDIFDMLVPAEDAVAEDDADESLEPDIPEEPLPEPVPDEPDDIIEFVDYEEPPEGDYITDDEPLMEHVIPPDARPSELPEIDTGTRTSVNAANWTTGVYVSVATICFFLFFYAIAPGDYAPGLAFIFGTWLLLGVYLGVTERAIFFRGDLRHASLFMVGIMFAAAVLLHWPMGILTTGDGLLGQPAIDRILLSISILLTCVGLLWIRARVRFVFTWFFGNLLLFLASLTAFMFPDIGSGMESPAVIVAGFGSGLVFLSLVFLQYERAINSSIETDIVRGDAHYLKRDYAKAMASYDDALAKAQMRKVEALGSPIVQYDVPWYSKGSALILMGEFEEGIRCLDMALAINPNNEVTWVNKGNAHSKLGQLDTAMECYRRAIECNPFYEIAWNNLGNVFARRKDFLDALKHYNRAIKINSRYDDAWINKGYVLAKMGKRDQAIKCLNHVGSRAKGSPPVMEKDVHVL